MTVMSESFSTLLVVGTWHWTRVRLSTSCINILGYCVGNGVIKPDQDRLLPLQKLPTPCDTKSLKRGLRLFAYYAKRISAFSEKNQPLKSVSSFPLSEETLDDFKMLKLESERAALCSIDESTPFVVECDVSDVAVSATSNQGRRPVAFMTRSLQWSNLH